MKMEKERMNKPDVKSAFQKGRAVVSLWSIQGTMHSNHPVEMVGDTGLLY